ncbi:MAG: hypothetical protein GY722_24510 [bacterium]|nr:hypothetical protein [bacterium]
MEARDSGSRIRPLPIDDLDGDVPQHQPIEPRRRIAPLIVIVAGAIAFGVIARGLSVGDSTEVGSRTTTPPATLAEEPVPTTTTTRTPPPQTLGRMLPMANGGIKLVTLTATKAQVGQWDSALTFPTYNANILQPRSAKYNADGRLVAVQTGVDAGSMVIDAAVGGSPTYIQENITSGSWHPTDPALFAWTEVEDETESTVVRVADLSRDSSAGVAALVEFSIPGIDHLLQAWGDWGFATSSDGTISGLDPDGIPVRSVAGEFFDAAVDGTLLIADMGAEGPTPFLLNVDGSIAALPSLDIGATDFRITGDGDWVLAATIQEDGHTSILARTVHARSTRLTSVDETARIIDTTWEDRFLVLQELESNDLLFKDWNTGAEFSVPMDDPVGAVFLSAELALIE